MRGKCYLTTVGKKTNSEDVTKHAFTVVFITYEHRLTIARLDCLETKGLNLIWCFCFKCFVIMLIYNNLMIFNNLVINKNVIVTACNLRVWTILLIILASLIISIAHTILFSKHFWWYNVEKFKHALPGVCFDFQSGYWNTVDGFGASSYWQLIIEITCVFFSAI